MPIYPGLIICQNQNEWWVVIAVDFNKETVTHSYLGMEGQRTSDGWGDNRHYSYLTTRQGLRVVWPERNIYA